MAPDYDLCCYAAPMPIRVTFLIPGGKVKLIGHRSRKGKGFSVVFYLRPQSDGHPIKRPAEIWKPPRAA